MQAIYSPSLRFSPIILAKNEKKSDSFSIEQIFSEYLPYFRHYFRFESEQKDGKMSAVLIKLRFSHMEHNK